MRYWGINKMEQNITNFKEIVKQIEEGKILLPDFQREFVWTEEETQKKIVASVLARMPIGSILLLESRAEEYSSKIIGCRNKKPNVNSDTLVKFLLDGQQRVTVLTNVFSNAIHNQCDKISDLISPKLKRRFFLRIPKWSNINDLPQISEANDLFGVYDLVFKYKNPDMEEPKFLSGDILPYVECFDFQKDDGKPYNPKVNLSTELDTFCVAYSEGYLVPLFLLVPSKGDRSAQIQLRYNTIVDEISKNIKNEIMSYYVDLSDSKKDIFIEKMFPEKSEQDVLKSNHDAFDGYMDYRVVNWKNELHQYLDSCVQKISLNQMIVKADQRARAIDIYENLNKGGVSLNTFDLIMARVAKVSKDNFYNRIVTYMKDEKAYNKAVLPDKIKKSIENLIDTKKYNATINTQCYDERKNVIISKYIDAFLDVLSLYCYNKNFEPELFKIENMKREQILRIDPEEINNNCETVCIALDRALFFFQTRCGIRYVSEINYSLMLVLIAVIFLRDELFVDKGVHDKLEAWYWSVVFSGEYDKDQNTNMISNLQSMVKTLTKTNDVSWIRDLSHYILNGQNFSDREFLLMTREERYPKIVMRSFICQYFLSLTYADMFDSTLILSVFSDKAGELEQHHIIPLGTTTKIGETTSKLRKDSSNICNSPLNFVYITKSANKEISDDTLDVYAKKILYSAKTALHISTSYTETTDLTNSDCVRSMLGERFDYLKGAIQQEVHELLL